MSEHLTLVDLNVTTGLPIMSTSCSDGRCACCFTRVRSQVFGSGQKGSVRRGSAKIEPGFFRFSPGRYVSGTSPVCDDITRSPTFCVLSTFSNRFFFRVLTGFFPGFFRIFSGVFKNLEKTWLNFHRPPPWPTPFGGPRGVHTRTWGVLAFVIGCSPEAAFSGKGGMAL